MDSDWSIHYLQLKCEATTVKAPYFVFSEPQKSYKIRGRFKEYDFWGSGITKKGHLILLHKCIVCFPYFVISETENGKKNMRKPLQNKGPQNKRASL